jgi:hypothetical protein
VPNSTTLLESVGKTISSIFVTPKKTEHDRQTVDVVNKIHQVGQRVLTTLNESIQENEQSKQHYVKIESILRKVGRRDVISVPQNTD